MPDMQRLNDLDLNLFVAFEALYRERSVTRAAEALGLTQPAMSHKLRRLRDTLGDPLFVPSPQGLLPTAAADAIAPAVQRALKSLDQTLSATAFDPATAERHFVLQMNDFAELLVLPKVLQRLKAEAPGITIETAPPAPDVARALEQGTIDVGFGAGMTLPASARTTRLSVDDFVVIAREDHPCIADGLTLDAYLSAEHVVVSPRGGTDTFVDRALQAIGVHRKIACRIRRFVTAPFLVAETDMLSTTPRPLYLSLRARLPIAAREVPFELPPVASSMFWHERMHHDPGHMWLRDMALKTRDEVQIGQSGSRDVK